MILSMTGYGKKSVQFLNKKITCEIKSLNSKALDLTTRVAPLYREREMEVRTLVGGALVRGKVECALWFEQESVCEGSVLNVPLMKEYLRQMLEAEQDGIPAPHDIGGALLRMPEVMTRHTEDALSEEEWQAALEAVRGALEQLTEFRRQEGEALERKFREKVDNIERLLAEIEPSPRKNSASPTTSTTSARRSRAKPDRAKSSVSSLRKWVARSTPRAASPTRPRCSSSWWA